MDILGLSFNFIAWFVLLVGGAELLIRGASRIALRLGIAPIIVGLTVVAFGTSMPELAVSVLANMGSAGGSDIAIGNIVGSNVANLGLILGCAAASTPSPSTATSSRSSIRRSSA